VKASLQGHVLAEAPDDEVVIIEGNAYFPPSAVTRGVLSESQTPYVCPWKGRCQYFDAAVDGKAAADAAWSCPTPLDSAVQRVGSDFEGFVAFSLVVTVERG
jgi:uncharacterized protein (DUF427 family)